MQSPYQKDEKWAYWEVGGKRYARVSGRTRVPSSVKTWAWCLRNDYEQSVDEAPWYHPEWDQDKRVFYWNYLRNPLQNARLYVWGVADRNYVVEVLEGNADPMVVQRDDVGETGYQRTRLHMDDGTSRDFVSYSSPHFTYQWGPQPSGFFGAKLNF